MNVRLAVRPAWTIAHRIWLDGRWGFGALAAAAVVCALAVRIAAAVFRPHVTQHVVVLMGSALALALTFLLCNFTEADRKERRSGFPARLFVLPVHTRILIGVPILFGVVIASIIFVAWATLALSILGRELRLGLSVLYIATGMVWYHAMVWSLAGYSVFRLLALSVGGAVFTIGWIPLHDHDWLVPLLGGAPVRLFIGGLLAIVGAGGLVVAYVAVETQRHGGLGASRRWGPLSELLVDALPRNQQRFDAPARAQFWLEWRRHGVLLPWCTAGVLILNMMVAPFVAPISASATMVIFELIVITPVALAFALGQGFGKADLWSREAGLSLFLATRPLHHTEWIGAKMKTAAVATVASWSIMAVLVPLWLWQWCDSRLLVNFWRAAERMYPPSVFYALPVLGIGILMVLTWRFLIASLFIGLAGRTWLLTVATCTVFLAWCAIPGLVVIWREWWHLVRPLLQWPAWSPWLVGALWVVKAVVAGLIANNARRHGWVDLRAIGRYLVVWFATTAFLLMAGWWLLPLSGWGRWLSVALILFAMPLLRVAYAPVALAGNRHR